MPDAAVISFGAASTNATIRLSDRQVVESWGARFFLLLTVYCGKRTMQENRDRLYLEQLGQQQSLTVNKYICDARMPCWQIKLVREHRQPKPCHNKGRRSLIHLTFKTPNPPISHVFSHEIWYYAPLSFYDLVALTI